MTSADCVIGIDCSTTATKAVVWDLKGREIAEGRAKFALSMPHSGWHEQDAEDWWRSTRQALEEAASKVDPRRIRAIGITHQRESFVCTDEEGKPLRPAILWLDERAGKEIERYGSEEVHRITGKPPDVTPAFYKLLWLRNNEPEILDRAARVLDAHSFLVGKLTGRWCTSWSSADTLGIVDMESFDWADSLLQEIGLSREQLPEIVPPGEVMGELSAEAANETELPEGLPVVGGAGDGQTAGLGADVTRPGKAYLNLGTAIVSGTYSDRYVWGREFRTLGGPIAGTYTLETLLRSGTYTISWFVENYGGVDAASLRLGLSDEEVLEVAAAKLPPGAEGLMVLPYLGACSTPYWDPRASGVVFGLRGRHTKAHVYRAILEGLAFEQRLCTDGMEKGLGQPIEKYAAMGGGSRSPLFCQIEADITGRNVTVCREVETTCLGAGIFAAAATGAYRDLREAAGAMSAEGRTYEPDDRRHAFYDRLYEDVYRRLYPQLCPLFPALGDATEKAPEVRI